MPDRKTCARGGIVSRRSLFARLDAAARVTHVSGPAGSGKTVLLRSWIGEAGLEKNAAWVAVQGEKCDPQRFWVSVVSALRGTAAGARLVQPLTAAPKLDGWAVAERLLEDLDPLEEPLWLVIDDMYELTSSEALRQLELLMLRASPKLRFVLSTRCDLRLRLHRLLLEGELTQIRAADLRFTTDEARVLFQAAGVQLPDPALAALMTRTEGWAAGLRLAALSLAGHPDPQRLAAEFSGSERTVAGYLLAEVLERQPEPVRRLLLRTSVLERVNGELADLLTGHRGGERILQDLEEAGAFVVALDAGRSWFRYYRLFADLLQLELRRTAPDEVAVLHRTAAGWFAEHGLGAEAVRHAQAAGDWSLAARLLSDHFLSLVLDGQSATAHDLLARFPADMAAADPELAAQMAGDKLLQGSLESAERHLAHATRGLASVPADRSGRLQIVLAIVRLCLAQRRGDLPAVAQEAQRLLAPAEAADVPQSVQGAGEDLRALALVTLGTAELWGAPAGQAERHLEQGIALAHRIGRPWIEVTGLAHWALATRLGSSARTVKRSTQALEVARVHGWTEEPAAAVAYLALAAVRTRQGRLGEAEPLLNQAERTLRPEAEPAAGLVLHSVRGGLELARGRNAKALSAFLAAEKLGELLVTSHALTTQTRSFLLRTLVKLGETGRAEIILAQMGQRERETGHMRIALAVLRLAQGDPHRAIDALAAVLDGSAPIAQPAWLAESFLLEAVARDALGDPAAAGRALEHALDLAEPDGALQPFLIHPAPKLLQRHAGNGTAHAGLITETLKLLWGARRPAPPARQPQCSPELLTSSETRVLFYLPTNLRTTEIAGEISVSVNTVRTHIRHLYGKLGAHSRADAIKRARALGLLAPSPS
ncbi:MAG TPA: LuxR C-terminal-related transcriptional regulator [Trebonia sp.]|nr:LuxR C-terminal-related transcriptional regulator [Trebonia sp.]